MGHNTGGPQDSLYVSLNMAPSFRPDTVKCSEILKDMGEGVQMSGTGSVSQSPGAGKAKRFSRYERKAQ